MFGYGITQGELSSAQIRMLFLAPASPKANVTGVRGQDKVWQMIVGSMQR